MSIPLVSIIIPTYNRAHLIGETLNSILAQTYTNWECIVVDDGSTDSTTKVMQKYCEQNNRIQYHQRPEDRPKGANACRNYGFELSKGEYINWFDSDDLMTDEHISIKVTKIIELNVDFVVAKTANFVNDNVLEPYKYELPEYGITAEDFILHKIKWYTYDVILKRKIADNIDFNERMESWQDYNYFCKMLLETTDGKYIDYVLTYRRLHENTIQSKMTSNLINFNKELLSAKYLNYIDLKSKLQNEIKKELLYALMNINFYLATDKVISKFSYKVNKEIYRNLGVKSLLNFNLALVSGLIIKKGHFFLEKAKQRR